jgi:hypothetical protein
MQVRYTPTERIGVNSIERIIIEDLKWIFREQAIVDVGIDAMIEVVKEGNPTGRFIAAQIKSGIGNFHSNENSFTYYASDIHYEYWTNCNLPVILIGYIPEDSVAYWEILSPENFIRTKRQWKIEISKKQKLSAKSENRLLILVGLPDIIEDITVQQVTVEYVLAKKEEIKNLHKSKDNIEELTGFLSIIKDKSDIFNDKLKKLMELGIGINDPRSKNNFKTLANQINNVNQNMEKSINNFSENFAIGSYAFHEILTYCKDFNLFDVLEEAKQGLISYPQSAETAIKQISDLKYTVDNFSKSNRELKNATIVLSEVLNLIIREFTVAKNTVENIIQFIEE